MSTEYGTNPPSNPIAPEGGFFSILNPSVTVDAPLQQPPGSNEMTPEMPVNPPSALPATPRWQEVGSPLIDSIEPAPGS
jgi:hypothetical protein